MQSGRTRRRLILSCVIITLISACGPEANMGTTYPPDGWGVDAGTWGTDLDQETSVVTMGAYAVKYISTAQAKSTIVTDYRPVTPGDAYRAFAYMRADNITAKNVYFWLAWYTPAKVVDSFEVVYEAPLSAANTWEWIEKIVNAPAGVAFVRLIVGRNTASFNAYSAFAGITEAPPMFRAYLDADTNHAALDTVVCDVEVFDFGSNYSTGTGQFTAPGEGVYTFNASATIDDLDAGEFAILGYKVNGNLTGFGQSCYPHSNNSSPGISVSMTLLLAINDTVEIVISHDHAGGNALLLGDAGTSLSTTFSGFRVE